MKLDHIAEDGYAKMVEVSAKQVSTRTAVAYGKITMLPETQKRIKEGGIKKGDVLAVAKVAGIMASKKTSDIIPMCHNIGLEGCNISFGFEGDTEITAIATVTTSAKTGVEMEAIVAVSVSLITIYDMAKAIDKGMTIGEISLLEKSGGRSGHYKKNI